MDAFLFSQRIFRKLYSPIWILRFRVAAVLFTISITRCSSGAYLTIWGKGRESGSDQSEHRWHQHSAAMHPVVDTMAFADTVTWYLLYLRFSVGLKP
uniref:Uncharacterized protein n=5 Tax=Klebsiella pneumoniae TaxID=573 RepID=A0A7U1BND6_KLEPN|nr:hypothetical protein [Klebsiella pneumoniae]